MENHLDIRINGQSLVLPNDFSLSVEEKNPVFNEMSFFSYPCKVRTDQNLSVLKNIGHQDSNMRGMDLEHAKAEIIVDGLPLNTGQVITDEDVKLSEDFSFNIDAQAQSFTDLIGDLECQDVKVKDHIVIGEKIGKIVLNGWVDAVQLCKTYNNSESELIRETIPYRLTKTFQDYVVDSPQALGFSYFGRTQGFPAAEKDDKGDPLTTESFINVTQPYPFPYCNARVAYAHPDVRNNSDGVPETSGTVKGNDANPLNTCDYGQYWCLDAARQQSGICFYVLYFLDCLFAQLGVVFDKTELLAIEDFSRLCFFTTHCHYDEEETGKTLTGEQINQWLTSRNCGGHLDFFIHTGKPKNKNPWISNYEWSDLREEYPINTNSSGQYIFFNDDFATPPTKFYGYRNLSSQITISTQVYDMIANSENFPKESVSTVISSLENSFGIRFLYNPESRKVTARLLRNIYKKQETRQFLGKVLSISPINEKITGVRVLYSEESDKKEQRNNVRYGVKDYNTEYDYIEYDKDRTITDKVYQQLVTETGLISSTNRNIYVDKTTGNTYRVKIDADADDISTLRPTLFQVAQYKGVEQGDCSEQNKDYVKEFSSSFQPLTNNIINAKDYNKDTSGTVAPILAPMLDVDMEHEYLEKKIEVVVHDLGEVQPVDYDMFGNTVLAFNESLYLKMVETLNLAESYDPTQTESGNSPLQDIEWGLTISIMRGGGNDAGLELFDKNYDHFGNDKWRQTVGTYAVSSDSVTPKGEMFDYNGQDPGLGGKHFSLEIRSWVQPEWSNVPLVVSDEEIRDRGLFDMFWRSHAYFLLNRKKFQIKATATIAQLIDIRNHWDSKYEMDGRIGFIDKLKYEIDRAKSIGTVEIIFFSI